MRFSDKDKIIVSIGNESQEFDLSCGHFLFIDVKTDLYRKETFNCLFNKKVISRNNTYEQLKSQVCDSYEIYCN